MAMFKVLPLLAFSLLAGGCSDMCGNTIVSQVTSPDGRRNAVMFQRDCGATTGFSTQVSILNAGKPLSGIGNVFRADDDHGAARAGEWGGPWTEIKWLAPDHLQVLYAAKSRLFAQEKDVSGVKITYQAIGD
jgi:hypothetical protein